MPFVIRRKSDGKFAYGRTRYAQDWKEDLQEARLYPSRGPATNSIKHTFASRSRYHRPTEEELADYEIVPVKLELADA